MEGGTILSAETQTNCSGKPLTILSGSADEHEHSKAIVTTAIEKHFKTAFIGLIGFRPPEDGSTNKELSWTAVVKLGLEGLDFGIDEGSDLEAWSSLVESGTEDLGVAGSLMCQCVDPSVQCNLYCTHEVKG